MDTRPINRCFKMIEKLGEDRCFMTRLRCCFVVFCALLLTFAAVAQVQNGQFTGTVTDPSGAAVPNAKVTIINQATNLSVAATTNQTGLYNARELPVGVYKITVEAPGFKTFSNAGVSLDAGTIAKVDVKMQLGQARELVEVTGEASAVNTEEAKLATTVTSTQIENLPLNGRNVYDLMQMAPGAVNVNGVDFENGHGTVVNGLREDFNGFLVNGVANKGLSGGVINTPIQDTVQEFQQLQLNVSAQYGNSAGSVNNLVTKSGTNALHGSLWEYARNSAFDANSYFLNQQGSPRLPLHFNQFGGTVGGAIIKDKLFFFGSYQGDRFLTSGLPSPITVESPEWRQAITSAEPGSVAALLYTDFKPGISGTPKFTLDQYLGGGVSANSHQPTGLTFGDYLCPDFVGSTLAAKFQTLFGVTPADVTYMTGTMASTGAACSSPPGLNPNGLISRSIPFLNSTTAVFGSQIQSIGDLFNGNEASGRLDYNWNANNRTYAQFNWMKQTDKFGPCSPACARGFSNPTRNIFPNGQLSYVRTFSPAVLNEFRVGYTQNNTGTAVSKPGVPQILMDDNSMGFGSYNGYPQFFKEHQYSYGDMVSISHGKHSVKVGVDIKRNIENSEFDIARGSYYFFDPIFFSADAPYAQASGVNPGFATSSPAALGDNVRHWRNLEFGTYVQDDWKVSRRLTLNLGLRYDLFTRHTEENGLATTFKMGPGNTFAQQIANANAPFSTATDPVTKAFLSTCNPSTVPVFNSQILAGVCGPGGFAKTGSLGKGDHNDFGPRVGFAWDVFGDGKTSLRGGVGVSYESTLYNPLSNSRWNPPYYSFGTGTNAIGNFPNGPIGGVIYGPTVCPTLSSCGPSGAPPTFSGPPTNPGQGIGAQATGNINGWNASTPLIAKLTGIVLPQGIRDPYVYNAFFSVQRELMPKLVVEVDYVGTAGHKLFRAENINRQVGGRLPNTICGTNNIGEGFCGLVGALNGTGRPNPNYGTMRLWQNAVNSNYNSLQVSAKKQMSHGVLFNVSYTWSHSIDDGSTWHSGATTADGAAAGDGYTTDNQRPGLDRGNSVFDIRQRLTLNYVWELPGQKLHGFLGTVAGGWSLNGIWSLQTGAHWSAYNGSGARVNCTDPTNIATCTNKGGDYNLDRTANDRPNSTASGFSGFSKGVWANGWVNPVSGGPEQSGLPSFSAPCLACVGNLGRNTFVGPGQWVTDMTLSKMFNFTERVHLKFEAAAFNIFNRANFLLATAGGAAHNNINDPLFGQAGGTLNPRELQLGLKMSF
jgi:hypothetical protein